MKTERDHSRYDRAPLTAQRRGELLLGPDPQGHPPQRLQVGRRPPGRHSSLYSAPQQRSHAFRLDETRGNNPRKAQAVA